MPVARSRSRDVADITRKLHSAPVRKQGDDDSRKFTFTFSSGEVDRNDWSPPPPDADSVGAGTTSEIQYSPVRCPIERDVVELVIALCDVFVFGMPGEQLIVKCPLGHQILHTGLALLSLDLNQGVIRRFRGELVGRECSHAGSDNEAFADKQATSFATPQANRQ